MTSRLFGLFAAALPFMLPAAASARTVDQQINEAVQPLTDALSAFIFFSVPVLGADVPLIVAWLILGAVIFTIYLRFINVTGFAHAVNIMRGKPNTDIELTIVREGESQPLIFNITREIIRVKSVKNRMLEPGYGYVRITNFQSRTTTDLLKAISDLQKEETLKGLVLDLRNNPGGVLNGAVGVSDAFIDNGLIVYTEGRIDDSSQRYVATPGDSLNGAPLVVLINGGSASASESGRRWP